MTTQLHVEPELGKFMRRLTPDELALLEASLVAEGVRDPLVVWRRNGDRVLLDGHHRYEIARRHGLDFQVQEIELPDLSAAKRWVIRNQLGRRNLTPAEVAYYRGHQYLQEKKSRGAEPGGRGNQYRVVSGQNVHLPTAEVLAAKHGVDEKTIRRDAAFAAALDRQAELHGEEFRASVLSRDAKITKSDVERLDDLSAEDPEKARQIVSAVLSGQAKDVREALREANRSEKLASLSDSTLPAGKFALIYADPPWRYDFAMDENRAVENHYPTMPLEELQTLPVADLAAEDCLLWLWATPPKLREALSLIEAWGFEYVTSLVWIKDQIGLGYYARQQHELLLVGKRGSPPAPAPEDRPASVITAPRTEHSAKPAEVYDLIERMYPGVAKLELFARRRRAGWVAWGNELAPA